MILVLAGEQLPAPKRMVLTGMAAPFFFYHFSR